MKPELIIVDILLKSSWSLTFIMNTLLILTIIDSTWVFCIVRADCKICISVSWIFRLPFSYWSSMSCRICLRVYAMPASMPKNLSSMSPMGTANGAVMNMTNLMTIRVLEARMKPCRLKTACGTTSPIKHSENVDSMKVCQPELIKLSRNTVTSELEATLARSSVDRMRLPFLRIGSKCLAWTFLVEMLSN